MEKKLLEAIATMVGFVVGAGILGLPFVFSKAGFWTGVMNVVVIGAAVLILNLMLGEISLRTKNSHQLSGYTSKYLGHKWKKIMVLLLLLGWYGALIAYTIKVGEFLSALLEPIASIQPIFLSIIFGIIGSSLVFKGLKIIKKSEFWMIAITLVVIVIIGIFSLPEIDVANVGGFSMPDMLLPFGVVLFAFGGAGAIPVMREELKSKRKLMKKAIIIGTVLSALIYLIFPFFVVGVTGAGTTDASILGLGDFLGYKMILIGSLFGILTMSTSFIAIGLAIKEVFKFDYNKTNFVSSSIACIVPFVSSIIIILFSIDNIFYKVIDISGAIIYPLTSVLFVMVFWAAKKKGDRKPEYNVSFGKILGGIIILIFLAGFINEIFRLFF